MLLLLMSVKGRIAQIRLHTEAALMNPSIIIMLRPPAFTSITIAFATVIIILVTVLRGIFLIFWVVCLVSLVTPLLLIHAWLLHLARSNLSHVWFHLALIGIYTGWLSLGFRHHVICLSIVTVASRQIMVMFVLLIGHLNIFEWYSRTQFVMTYVDYNFILIIRNSIAANNLYRLYYIKTLLSPIILIH